MHPALKGWIACPTCGGDLVDEDSGVRCLGCGTTFAQQGNWLDLVDPKQKVSSEGPGDTLAMAWRRRRWDELRGPEAPENADYLAAIWERLRPDDRVLDLACGPASRRPSGPSVHARTSCWPGRAPAGACRSTTALATSF
jgi:hypothetical protein